MTKLAPWWEKPLKSAIRALILEKSLRDTCEIHLAALQQFHFAAQQTHPISNCDSTTNEERIPKMLLSVIHFLHAWKRYGAAVRELSNLNDRELADIGITRSDIPRLAWEHAKV
jgi:uncharacterized protein YjiS (DUF1127 family)